MVDEQHWSPGHWWEERRVLPFLERDGSYWGLPPDDDTAILELQDMVKKGARYLVFISSTFWWMDYYKGLAVWLAEKARVVLDSPRLRVFDLGSQGKG